MVDDNETQPKIQICTLRIMFPVDTDEQAIEYKKKIGDVLAAMPKARIEFALSTVPDMPMPRG